MARAVCLILACCLTAPGVEQKPEERAIAYLAREVAQWRGSNGCFSCHNNGDGARALYQAMEAGKSVPSAALEETTRFLADPAQWDQNKMDEAFSDKGLARIQFAVAVAAAYESGAIKDRSAVEQAASMLTGLQGTDGSWPIATGALPGAPATYGTALATLLVKRTLAAASRERFKEQISEAEKWLASLSPRSAPDAAAALMSDARHARAWEFIEQAQTSDGGWGPRLHAPAEAFDTAVILLALAAAKSERGDRLIGRGRAFLISIQQPTGGWPETTRPSGAQSYAQHISTTSWALMALLATDSKRH